MNEAELLAPESNDSLSQITKAEIDIQIATARRYPRVLSKVKAGMLSFATLDEETAQGCFYTLPRGGKNIQGPSIRLAEIAASCFGNLKAGTRPIQTVTTGDNPHVIVQAVAFDIENNTSISIEKRGRIFRKKGRMPGEFKAVDEDDINLAVNRCSAIALRDAIFKVVPLALVKPVMDEAKRVAIGDVKSLAAKREKVVERLKAMGAQPANIFAKVGASKIEDIDLDKLETLIGLGTALKDGETSLEEAFPFPTQKTEAPKTEPKAETKAEKKDAEATKEPEDNVPMGDDKPAAESAQSKLMGMLQAEGYGFAELMEWAVSSGNLDAPVNSPDEIPTKSAEQWFKAKTGLLKGLAAGRAK